jgi:hypothetical protein
MGFLGVLGDAFALAAHLAFRAGRRFFGCRRFVRVTGPFE